MARKSGSTQTGRARPTSASGRTRKSPAKTTRKTQRRCTIVFKVNAPDAKSVDIAGSFTNWALKGMKRTANGIWKATFRPAPGTYHYKFLVDHEWIPDPANPASETDEYGNVNSVIVLE